MKLSSVLLGGAAAVFALSLSAPAQADDWGCEVLLCLASPKSPTEFKECIPPIRRLWRTLARGKGFPSCEMNSKTSEARHEWASANNCPPGQLYWVGDRAECSMRGVVTVTINGAVQSRTWWSNADVIAEDVDASTSAPASLLQGAGALR